MKNNPPVMIVTKASGEKADFSVKKLRRSLERSGTNPLIADEIIREIRDKLYEGIFTRSIYQMAFSLLKQKSRVNAGKYRIKKAIMELGPSGFPFEKYIAEILKAKGYETKVNQLLTGKCVTHEIDVMAEEGDRLFLIECKFHQRHGISCDVKVPLYIHSRFNDVEKGYLQTDGAKLNQHEGWLITNTRFTPDAIQYGNCAGLKLIGWNYPPKGNLQEWIDTSGLYPITCLTSLTKTEKADILAKGIVLCKDLVDGRHLLENLGMSERRIKVTLEESNRITTLEV